MSPWLDAVLRWMHVLAGVLWLGQIHFASFVEARAGARSVEPGGAEGRARALHWLRWGAAYTWLTGLMLMGVVYYSTLDNLVRREVRFAFKYGLTTEFVLATNEPVVARGTGVWISLASLAAAFLAYEGVWKVFRKHERAGAAASLALLGVGVFFLARVFTGRALFLHAGALLGSIMAANVWTRIGPAQRRALRAAQGLAPDPGASLSPLARQRARHNAYLSVPVLFAMVSNHYPAITDREDGWAIVLGVVLAGWAITWWLHERAARAAQASSSAGGRPDAARPADSEA